MHNGLEDTNENLVVVYEKMGGCIYAVLSKMKQRLDYC